eukprot:Gb_39870 [translate_table: standard]
MEAKRGHPLLRGGRPPYPHTLSEAQMEALTAICDTLIPSIDPPMEPGNGQRGGNAVSSRKVEEFYRLSGAEYGVPEHIAGLIAKHHIKPVGIFMQSVLYLLSTRLGTFFLCGRRSLSMAFPYVQKFAAVPLSKREKILVSWTTATAFALGFLLRLAFKAFKSTCLLAFYSLPDANGSNPAWSAIGYTVPDLPDDRSEAARRPLETGIIDTASGAKILGHFLENANFSVTEDCVECRNARLGYGVENVPRNSSADHFCGSCNLGCRTGDKKGTGETWLVDAVNAGARILAGCKAKTVLHVPTSGQGQKKKRVEGVFAMLGDGPDHVFVQARAVVVASGALGTPPLLRGSGLGNSSIGKNLHLHPVRVAWGYFPDGEGPDGRNCEGGIITSMSKEGAKWDESGYGTILQTPIAQPGIFAAQIPWTSGLDMKERMLRYYRTTNLFALVRDQGSGRVWRERYLSYNSDVSDEENLADGLERALRILIAAGATEVGTGQSDGERFVAQGATQGEIEDYLDRVRRRNVSKNVWNQLLSAHQLGSCRMGVDPATSSVDENGETWEVKGLFVSDASVLPTALGVNPMITVESVAFCISRRVSRFLQTGNPSS